jgi:ABC-2 type transport system ATP-binding protein
VVAITLEARGLTKRFGARVAVDGLSFTAGAGDLVGLLGPNGAGKTTAIRMLTTMLTPTSGDFRIDNVPSSSPGQIRRRIGVLPESAGYPDRQTAAQYLRFYGRLFGSSVSDAARIADRLLDEVGLADRAGSPIGTFSRGMRQRLGIARSLLNDPAVVFLDEPTLGLDPAGQRQVLSILREIAARRGATVVLSTHLLSEVEQVCSRVLILDHGKLITDDSVSSVLSRRSGPSSAQLRVPPELLQRAVQALASLGGCSAEVFDERSGTLAVTVDEAANQQAQPLNSALEAVLAAGVPVLFFQLDRTRLTDAFLALTNSGGEP